LKVPRYYNRSGENGCLGAVEGRFGAESVEFAGEVLEGLQADPPFVPPSDSPFEA
jgi:hypothetical protein